VKVFTHNFNPNSQSGPNKFTSQLFEKLSEKGVTITGQEDCDIEFCLIQQQAYKKKPMVLRLDGIYFNSEQDFENQNAPIRYAYNNADAVIFQSNFNKVLTEMWFGEHKNGHVIHNAYLKDVVKDDIFKNAFQGKEIWSCASTWRPHKRLTENVRYYLENSPDNAILIVAGGGMSESEKRWLSNIPENYMHKPIMVYGNLDYLTLRKLYDASTTFLHLAYLDHCPNVVVDAIAHGCKIVCSSTGGTSELVRQGTIIQEEEWDFKPIPLYEPPQMDFDNFVVKNKSNDNSLKNCLEMYYNIFKEV
jgi:glycosyltransferase involved in cell wall biosynthesis